MQNNVTELTQRLLRSLDNNYNVIDMPMVVDVIAVLENLPITKEQLETTRLGRHINELRRRTTNEDVARRTKELVKRWRSLLLPDSNGQINSLKRPNSDRLEPAAVKRRVNGTSELDLSDNSNSSFKDVNFKDIIKKEVILINSDSNSSAPEVKAEPQLEQPQPKKRGRKKGSKNHKNLIDEAETSFSNKMAVSRGNAKVKTTQELVASLQNKSSLLQPTNKIKDLDEKAAKLTERVSLIDQKLYSNSNNFRNKKGKVTIDSPAQNQAKEEEIKEDHEEIVIVDEKEPETVKKEEEKMEEVESAKEDNVPRSLSVEECLRLLPPIKPIEPDPDEEETCTCTLKENRPDFSLDDDDESAQNIQKTYEFVEDPNCQARQCLREKYKLDKIDDGRIREFHECFIDKLNANLSACGYLEPAKTDKDGLYENVVPNRNLEWIPKCGNSDFSVDDYKRYRISETESYREFHQTVDVQSYEGATLRVLPYCIID